MHFLLVTLQYFQSLSTIMSSKIFTPKSKLMTSGFNDSGYDGQDSAQKMPFGPEVKLNTKSKKVQANTDEDIFWVSFANSLLVLVLAASLCYFMVMGDLNQVQEDDGEDLEVKLGGKRAAIQFYYNSYYGKESGMGAN